MFDFLFDLADPQKSKGRFRLLMREPEVTLGSKFLPKQHEDTLKATRPEGEPPPSTSLYVLTIVHVLYFIIKLNDTKESYGCLQCSTWYWS